MSELKLDSYDELKERYRKLQFENIRMNRILTKIWLTFNDSVNMYVINEKLKTIRRLIDDYIKGTGDAEIVRCRNCAYVCYRKYANGLAFYTCSYFDSEHAEVNLDGFCAWGVRRGDAE